MLLTVIHSLTTTVILREPEKRIKAMLALNLEAMIQVSFKSLRCYRLNKNDKASFVGLRVEMVQNQRVQKSLLHKYVIHC